MPITSSPDAKKKRLALPSLLSNLRNAQAAIGIGRAAEDLHDRETRPLVGGGSGGRKPSPAPQLHRSAQPASLSSTLKNFSQRFGSQWRKRRRKGQGVTSVPQSFFVAVGCFFFALPVFLVMYILARHAVFGDESDISSTKVHIHEVPTSFGNGMDFESGKEILERNKIVFPEVPDDGAKDVGENSANQSAMTEVVTIDSEMVRGEEGLPAGLDQTATDVLQVDEKQGESDKANSDVSIENPGMVERMEDANVGTKVDGSIEEVIKNSSDNAIGEADTSILAQKEIKSSNVLKENNEGNPEPPEKALISDTFSTSIRKEKIVIIADPSSDQAEEGGDGGKDKEAYHNSLRGSKDGR